MTLASLFLFAIPPTKHTIRPHRPLPLGIKTAGCVLRMCHLRGPGSSLHPRQLPKKLEQLLLRLRHNPYPRTAANQKVPPCQIAGQMPALEKSRGKRAALVNYRPPCTPGVPNGVYGTRSHCKEMADTTAVCMIQTKRKLLHTTLKLKRRVHT
jgi:hypothetical protein